MKATPPAALRRDASPTLPRIVGALGAALALAAGAQAQSPSCELLKQSLAARIAPEIRGYSMDDVPAAAPVPAGGKVIGTCEGGARKVVYRRFGGPATQDDAPLTAQATPAPTATEASAAATSPSAAPPASAPSPAATTPRPTSTTPTSTAAARPEAASPRPATASASAPQRAASKPVASAPAAPKPVVASRALRASAPASTPAPEPLKPVAASASTVLAAFAPSAMPLTALAPATLASAPMLAAPGAPVGDAGFLSAYGHWLWLLAAVPLAAWLWAWVAHRMAYDEAGLPRGPRLRL